MNFGFSLVTDCPTRILLVFSQSLCKLNCDGVGQGERKHLSIFLLIYPYVSSKIGKEKEREEKWEK